MGNFDDRSNVIDLARYRRRRRLCLRQHGAALVEFAIAAPLLILLLFGIIEFGWVLAQFNEVRHAGQEGARWAAVSRPDVNGDGALNSGDLIARVCGAANLPSGSSISFDASPGSGVKGDTATVTVTAVIAPLTGMTFVTSFLPPSISSTATFRLEQNAGWTSVGSATCP